MNNVDSLFFRGGDLSGRSTDNARSFRPPRSAGEDAARDRYAFMRVGGGSKEGGRGCKYIGSNITPSPSSLSTPLPHLTQSPTLLVPIGPLSRVSLSLSSLLSSCS